MKIFYSFVIILCSVFLILLPINQGVYNFQNGQRTDNFTVTTTGTTNATVQLFKVLTANDTSKIQMSSNDTTEIPTFYSYNGSTRALLVTGLTTNVTRALTVTYDTPVITNNSMVTFLNIIPWIWVLIWVVFPVIAILVLKPWKRQ